MREGRGQRREKKGKEPQDGLRLRTTACKRPMEIPGGGWWPTATLRTNEMFGISMLSTLLCANLPLPPYRVSIPVKALCEWKVFVEIEEGADFHIGVYVILNRNSSLGRRILEPQVIVKI